MNFGEATSNQKQNRSALLKKENPMKNLVTEFKTAAVILFAGFAVAAGVYILVRAAEYVTFENASWFVVGGVVLVLGGVILLRKE
jgi:uncharacterized membrane protein HdeD (DUF308 family)